MPQASKDFNIFKKLQLYIWCFMWYFILCDVFSTYVFTIIYVDIFQGRKGEKKLRVKRNLGTSNRWPHTVPNTCFEVPLDEVLRTSWRRPESTSKGSPLGVRLGRPFKTFPGLKFRMSLGCKFGTSPRCSNRILKGRPGKVGGRGTRDQYFLAE